MIIATAILLGVAGCAASGERDAADFLAATGSNHAIVNGDSAPISGGARRTLPTSVEVHREPWQFGSDQGQVAITPHYRFYTTITSERILDRFPLFMERALARYASELAALPLPTERLETYLFRDRRQWTAKTREMLPQQASTFENLGRGGFTTRGISVLYHIDWRRDWYRDTFAIASHEGWHQYTQKTFRNPLPIWLEEGIATYMEGFRYDRETGLPEFDPARNLERRMALRDAIRRGDLIPLRELVSQTPQSFLSDGKDRLLTYYAQVWALTRFIVEADNGRHLTALEQALSDAAGGTLLRTMVRSPEVLANGGRSGVLSGRTGPWIIIAYFTSDLSAFERDYLAFAREIAD